MWPILISSISLLISLFVLWKVHLSPFCLNVSNGDPFLILFKSPIKSSSEPKSIRYIPIIHLPISFVNSGARAGRVINLEIIFCLINSDKKYRQVFKAEYFINYSKTPKSMGKLSVHDWIKECVEGKFYPFFVLPGQSINKEVVLSTLNNWNKFPPYGNYKITIQIKNDEDDKWKKISEYKFIVNKTSESILKREDCGIIIALPLSGKKAIYTSMDGEIIRDKPN